MSFVLVQLGLLLTTLLLIKGAWGVSGRVAYQRT
jgi:hypothetical protein